MKTLIQIPVILVIALALTVQPGWSQTKSQPTPDPGKPSIGISGGHYGYDPALGVEFTSRAIFQNHLSLRLRANKLWLEDYKALHDEWVSYHTFSAGLVYNGALFDRTRFFAELGMVGIVPNQKFSESGLVEGLYQISGVEINLIKKESYSLCLYLGIGPAVVKAYAEKIEGRPRYGQGLYYINGVRAYLGKN